MVGKTVQEYAPAKINLFLHILGRRADGYHNLDSLVAFASVGDQLTLTQSANYSLEVTGPFATTLVADESEPNLVLQAADVVSHCVKEIPPGGSFVLEKNLPIASGIGGGSSDAAACIRAMLRLHDQQLSDIARQQIALAIGADVSVCLLSKAARMTGAGHTIEPFKKFPRIFAVLVNPGVKVSTADIFKALQMEKGDSTEKEICPLPGSFASAEHLCRFLEDTQNDMEAYARLHAPVISSVIAAIEKQNACLLARMSGSGATCFGIFSSEDQAKLAAQRLQQDHPNWWVEACHLS